MPALKRKLKNWGRPEFFFADKLAAQEINTAWVMRSVDEEEMAVTAQGQPGANAIAPEDNAFADIVLHCPSSKDQLKILLALDPMQQKAVQEKLDLAAQADPSLRPYAKRTDINYAKRRRLLKASVSTGIALLVAMLALGGVYFEIILGFLSEFIKSPLAYQCLGVFGLALSVVKISYSIYHNLSHKYNRPKDKALKIVSDTSARLLEMGGYSLYIYLGGVGIAFGLLGLLPGILFVSAALVDVAKEAIKYYRALHLPTNQLDARDKIRQEENRRAKGRLVLLKVGIAALVAVFMVVFCFVPNPSVAFWVGIGGIFIVAPLLKKFFANRIRARMERRQAQRIEQLKDDFVLSKAELNRRAKFKYKFAIYWAKRQGQKESRHEKIDTLHSYINSIDRLEGERKAVENEAIDIYGKISLLFNENRDLDPTACTRGQKISPWITLLTQYRLGYYSHNHFHQKIARQLLELFQQRLLYLMVRAIRDRNLVEVKRLLAAGLKPSAMMMGIDGVPEAYQGKTLLTYMHELYYRKVGEKTIAHQEYKYFYQAIKEAEDKHKARHRAKVFGLALGIPSIIFAGTMGFISGLYPGEISALLQSLAVDFIVLGSAGLAVNFVIFAWRAYRLKQEGGTRRRKIQKASYDFARLLLSAGSHIGLMFGHMLSFGVLTCAAASIGFIKEVVEYYRLKIRLDAYNEKHHGRSNGNGQLDPVNVHDNEISHIVKTHRLQEKKQRLLIKAVTLSVLMGGAILLSFLPGSLLVAASAVAVVAMVLVAQESMMYLVHKHHSHKAEQAVSAVYKTEVASGPQQPMHYRLEENAGSNPLNAPLSRSEQRSRVEFDNAQFPAGVNRINFEQNYEMLQQVLKESRVMCQRTNDGSLRTQLDDARVTWKANQAKIMAETVDGFKQSIQLILQAGRQLTEKSAPQGLRIPVFVRIRGDLNAQQREIWQAECQKFGLVDVTGLTTAEIQARVGNLSAGNGMRLARPEG